MFWQGPISTAPHEVLLYLAHFNFQHLTEHVSGVLNTAADAISRNNLPHLSSLLPQTPQTRIPHSPVDLLVKQTPNWGSRTWIRLFQCSLLEASPQPPSLHIGQVNAANLNFCTRFNLQPLPLHRFLAYLACSSLLLSGCNFTTSCQRGSTTPTY